MTDQAWQRQSGETPKAYSAFCAYYALPAAERSLVKAWAVYQQQNGNKTATMPGYFGAWSTKNNWVARAAAYDEHLQARRDEAYEVTRLQQRATRQQVVQALNGLMGQVMNANAASRDKEPMTPQQLNALARAAAVVLNESRTEFDDLPTQRMDNMVRGTGEGGAIVHELVLRRVEGRADDASDQR